MNYYDEIISEIKELIKDRNLEEALEKVKVELGMPYIPMNAEKELRSLYKEIISEINTNTKTQRVIPDDEELCEDLFSTNLDEAMGAVQILRKLNLKDYYELIGKYLKTPIYDEVASLLVYMLIEDKCAEKFVVLKDGLEITFIPNMCQLPEEVESTAYGMKYLEEIIEKDPTILKMCKDMLHLKILMNLPSSYDLDEMKILTQAIVVQVYQAMDLEGELDAIVKVNGWDLEKIEKMSGR